jgi:hypothetical protein
VASTDSVSATGAETGPETLAGTESGPGPAAVPASEAMPATEPGSTAETEPAVQPWSAAEFGMLGDAMTAAFGSSEAAPDPTAEPGPAPIATELDHPGLDQPGPGHPAPGDSEPGDPAASNRGPAADAASAADSGDPGSRPADGDGYPANEGSAAPDEEHPPF